MTKPPENWQAIAISMIEDIDKQIYTLSELRDMLEATVQEDDYQSFRFVLKYLGREEDD